MTAYTPTAGLWIVEVLEPGQDWEPVSYSAQYSYARAEDVASEWRQQHPRFQYRTRKYISEEAIDMGPTLGPDELWWLLKLYSTTWQWPGPDSEAAVHLPRLVTLGLAEPTKVGESDCFRITEAGRVRVAQACGITKDHR